MKRIASSFTETAVQPRFFLPFLIFEVNLDEEIIP